MFGEGVSEITGDDIPQPNPVIFTATGEQLSIGAETHAIDCTGVFDDGVSELPGDDIPQLNTSIHTSTCKYLPVGTETHANDTVTGADESLTAFTGDDIPQLDNVVRIASTGKFLPIRTEMQTGPGPITEMQTETVLMGLSNGISREGFQEFSGVDIPQPKRFVATSTKECLPIGVEMDARYTAGVSSEGLAEFARCHVP